MPVVVTGSAGFIGTALVDELLAHGERVIGVDRRVQPARPGLLVLTTDLLDRPDELLDAALDGADAIFHLAGCPGVRAAAADTPHRRRRDNVDATARVLAAVPAHVPVVVTSSSSVYGGTHGRPSRESDALWPRGGYARSKAAAEALCNRRLRAGGLVAVARPFTVIGEGQRPDMAISRWLADAAAGRPLPVFGSLRRSRDLTDVRDAVRVLIALAGGRVCGPVNVGTGQQHTLAEIVAAISTVTGLTVETVVTPAARIEPADTCADTRLLRETVGFVPRTDLVAAVARQLSASMLVSP